MCVIDLHGNNYIFWIILLQMQNTNTIKNINYYME